MTNLEYNMKNKVIKAYTDLEQSKKLAEILPLESADMCFANDGTAIKIDANSYNVRKLMWKDYVVEVIPCWSLAALRSCLPPGISIDGILYVFESHNTFDNMWVYEYKFEDISAPLYSKSLNEIDAAIDMIIQLKENKMI